MTEINRSSITGQFVSDNYAEKHPDITVTEEPSLVQVTPRELVIKIDGPDEAFDKVAAILVGQGNIIVTVNDAEQIITISSR